MGIGARDAPDSGNALSCSRYHNFIHSHADLVEIAIRSNLVDSFGSGVIITGPGWLYFAPTYYAQQLFSRAARSYPLQIERAQQLDWHLQEPNLSAVLNEDGKTLRIYSVNFTPSERRVHFRLSDFTSSIVKGLQTVLKDREGTLSTEVMNSLSEPERISLNSLPLEVKGTEFEFGFEPFSLTLLELELE